jgi:hypothetical protein
MSIGSGRERAHWHRFARFGAEGYRGGKESVASGQIEYTGLFRREVGNSPVEAGLPGAGLVEVRFADIYHLASMATALATSIAFKYDTAGAR